jgi:cation:H+ antiporter
MSLSLAILLLALASVVVTVAGTRLTQVGDQLADLTGLGEAVVGALLLGITTSLPGIITTVYAAWTQHPELAVSNAIGGIAAQTFFLAIADIVYRRTNLEHAAASFANLMQGVLLMGLLAMILVGSSGPDLSFFHIHPLSLLMIFAYLAGSRLISQASRNPMWSPKITQDTVEDIPDDKDQTNLTLRGVAVRFALLALLVAGAGYTLAKAGIAIAEQSGLSEGMVGSLFTAISSSLPELVVSVAAVRRGALTLAVGNIIGGNTFDVIFVSLADLSYFEGSIFHAITDEQLFTVALTLLMTAVLLLGLLHREKRGFGNIGWESLSLILLYLGGNAFIYLA